MKGSDLDNTGKVNKFSQLGTILRICLLEKLDQALITKTRKGNKE
jgi:hypothetical protein